MFGNGAMIGIPNTPLQKQKLSLEKLGEVVLGWTVKALFVHRKEGVIDPIFNTVIWGLDWCVLLRIHSDKN